MDKIDLNELERLAKAATPGPWYPANNHTAYDGYGDSVCTTEQTHNLDNNLTYIVAACNHAPELVARVRGQELINSHLRNQVKGLEELTDDLRANEHELAKQLDFVANCLAQSEKCFMPKDFSCSYRTPYGLYCHAEKSIRLNCIYCRAEEAAKQADMEVEDAD